MADEVLIERIRKREQERDECRKERDDLRLFAEKLMTLDPDFRKRWLVEASRVRKRAETQGESVGDKDVWQVMWEEYKYKVETVDLSVFTIQERARN